MRKTIVAAIALLFLSTTVATAGKAPKFNKFQSSYSYVIGKIGGNAAKKNKARAIMRKVRSKMKTMDRLAFYSLVDSEEKKLFALVQ